MAIHKETLEDFSYARLKLIARRCEYYHAVDAHNGDASVKYQHTFQSCAAYRMWCELDTQ